MTPVVVTGATGWIGRSLVARFRSHGVDLVTVGRPEPGRCFGASRGGVIVHLAALAHRDPRTCSDAEYMRVNRDLTLALAKDAVRAGAARFVFVSTATVMGDRSARPWRETDVPAPQDAYACSKWAAEQSLRAIGRDAMQVIVARPPLVYGPGVRANFRRLLDVSASNVPLPLAGATAPRSMVYLDNLVDALVHLATSTTLGEGTFFVRDDADRSVAGLIGALRRSSGQRRLLFNVPRPLLAAGAAVAGQAGMYVRLFEPMQVDDSALRATGWRPPVSPDDALAATVAWHRAIGPNRAEPEAHSRASERSERGLPPT